MISDTPEYLEGALDLESMIRNAENKYLLVNVLATRAKELNEGMRPTLRFEERRTPLEISIAEAYAGNLKIVKSEKEPVVVDLAEAEVG